MGRRSGGGRVVGLWIGPGPVNPSDSGFVVGRLGPAVSDGEGLFYYTDKALWFIGCYLG